MASLRGLLKWTEKLNPSWHGQGIPGHLPLQIQKKGNLATIGHVNERMFAELQESKQAGRLFQFEDRKAVIIKQEIDSEQARSSLIAGICEEFRDKGIIDGWRNELYPVTENFYSEPIMLIERAAAVHFGIKSYGVHMNGFVRDGSQLKLWVARRAKNKSTWPGKLDHLCAGGQPHGISPRENMIKECWEEAGISRSIAEIVKPAGAISYAYIQKDGVKRDCLFCFDLELPKDFEPKAVDGEVESFELMEIKRVQELICNTEEFKDNCNLIIIDFLIRHGVVGPESPEYLDIVRNLRQGDCR